MREASAYILYSLLKDLGEAANSLPLSPSLVEWLNNQSFFTASLTPGLSLVETWFERIHPSWFVTYFRTLPEEDIQKFLSIFRTENRKTVKKLLLVTEADVELHSSTKLFLRSFLWGKLPSAPSPLELEALVHKKVEEPGLHRLYRLDPSFLRNLPRFLGLHDLAGSLPHLIDAQKIKKIQESLTPSEKSYLQYLSKKSSITALAKMHFTQWNEDPLLLKEILYERGVDRLAKLTMQEPFALKWYLIHVLEETHGQLFKKAYLHPPPEKMVTQMQEELLELLSFVK